jgi:hypothetical protein
MKHSSSIVSSDDESTKYGAETEGKSARISQMMGGIGPFSNIDRWRIEMPSIEQRSKHPSSKTLIGKSEVTLVR